MSRPIDPHHRETLVLTFRITRPLAEALDAELARFLAEHPGFNGSRGAMARIALHRAFLPEAPALEWDETPVEVEVRS